MGIDSRDNAVAIGDMNFNAIGPNNELTQQAIRRAEPYMKWYEDSMKREAMLPGGFGELIYRAEDAGDLARLVQAIEEQDIRAIFVETSISDQLARVVAEEIGPQVQVYTLYTGALGEPGSGADSYLGMMRANMETIATALGS